MIQPQSDAGDVGPRTAVLVPLRSLRSGKLRLAGSLAPDARARLIERMAATVLRAAGDLPVLVVYDDPEVAEWSVQQGAMSLRGVDPGLNNAVSEGRVRLEDMGFSTVIVAHADLPRARDLARVADTEGITIVPDRLGDGTNVLCLPTRLPFRFAYGPGSFEVHHRLALESGVPVRVLHDPELAWDVDHPDDLEPTQEEQR